MRKRAKMKLCARGMKSVLLLAGGNDDEEDEEDGDSGDSRLAQWADKGIISSGSNYLVKYAEHDMIFREKTGISKPPKKKGYFYSS